MPVLMRRASVLRVGTWATRPCRIAALLGAIAFVHIDARAQTGPRLAWDEDPTAVVTGYAVTIDGVRIDYGLAPLDASGMCGCSIPLPFSGGQHTLIVSAYNANGQADSAPFVVAPTASAGGPYTGQVGTALVVNGSGSSASTGTIVMYAWNWGDGTSTSSGSPTPAHTYASQGTFTIGLTVSDNAGATATATTTATIALRTDQPPSVNLTAPTNGSTFTAPATIRLTATASDAVGRVARVDFYANGVLIGSATSAPYTFSWMNEAAGSYSLVAVATNNSGLTATSAAVGVSVTLPPPLAITCPAPTAISPSETPVAVNFAPTVTGGQPPVTTTCSPASGSLFPVGTTPVGCTATDALGGTAACQTVVTVLGCGFGVSPTSQTIAAGGDTTTATVIATSTCSWTATSNVSWITVTAGANGTGNGTVTYVTDANPSTSSRTGTLTVAGLTVTVTQHRARRNAI